MPSILSWLFTTPDGWTALATLGLWIWNKVASKKADDRRKSIGQYAAEAFQVAEKAGIVDKLDGKGKYKVFIQTIVDALSADGEKDLSAKEAAQLFEFAKRAAWIAKTPPAPSRLPLPAPPPHPHG